MQMNFINNLLVVSGILIFGVVFFIYSVVRYPRYPSRINRFEDIPTTTFDISTAPTPANKNTTCGNSTDMISVCMNYDNCCMGSGANPNSKCFCSHPFVGGCNDAYKACLAGIGTGGDTSKCDTTLKGCCSKYSEIDIFSSNFQKPINASQSSNQICTLNGLANLEQRCMEICQTNQACKAYSLAIGGCTLYDSVNNNSGKSGDNYIYVVKK
jgi:hypothetical protein